MSLPTNSSSEPLSRQPRCSALSAANYARMLTGCYRKGEVSDPEVFSRGVVAVFREYPEWAVQAVANPAGGLPSRLQWLPTIAEVKGACEAEVGHLKRSEERQDRYIPRALPPPPDPERDKRIGDGLAALAKELRGVDREKPAETPDQIMARLEAERAAGGVLRGGVVISTADLRDKLDAYRSTPLPRQERSAT
jgi:hypothetical protein